MGKGKEKKEYLIDMQLSKIFFPLFKAFYILNIGPGWQFPGSELQYSAALLRPAEALGLRGVRVLLHLRGLVLRTYIIQVHYRKEDANVRIEGATARLKGATARLKGATSRIKGSTARIEGATTASMKGASGRIEAPLLE